VLANSLGAGGAAVPGATPQTVAAVREAFVSSLGTGLLIGAIVTALGAVLAGLLIERKLSPATPISAETPAPVGTREPSKADAELAA
jgi:H+/gluconate symporter-like permease